ncbi:g6111 [Coccomyxa elongata]
MVRLAYAAINAVGEGEEEQQGVETLEAQEARVANTYMRALQLVQEESREEAKALFEALLVDPMLAEGSKDGELAMASAKQIRHLVLKNLAALLADTDDSAKRALKLYAQALLLDDGDAVVWNRMGTLAAECGQWGAARAVFEHGLARHPRHALMLEKLVEVLMRLGDWHAALPLIKRILLRDPNHPRARHLAAFLEQPSEAGLDANALLQARFRQRLLHTDSFYARAGPMAPCHVALPSGSWAVLLRTTAQLLQGTGTAHGYVSAGKPVIFHLPGEEKIRSGPADETVGEHIEAPHAPENGSARVSADVTGRGDHANGSAADQGVKVLVSEQRSKVARKSIGEFREQLLRGQIEQEPDQATEEADGDSDISRRAASREGTAGPQEKVGDGQGGAAHGAVSTPKKDMPAPSRVSRRLEARREGRAGADDEGAAASEAVNIIAMLFLFLPELPPQPAATGSDAANPCLKTPGSNGEFAALTPASTKEDAIIDSREEEQAVRAFLHARPAEDSVHNLAVSAVEQLASDPCRRLSPVTLLALLDAAAALGSGWWPTPSAALTLAELHLDRAVSLGAASVAVTLAQPTMEAQEGAQPAASAALSGRTAASKRSKAAQEAAAASHIRSCEAFLAAFLMHKLQSMTDDQTMVSTDDMMVQRPQLARHQWALGRLAELRRDFAAATKHFTACQDLCAGISTAHGPSARDPLCIRCVHYDKDAEISATTAASKVESLQLLELLESSNRNVQDGRSAVVIAQLTPALLGDDMATGRALRSERKKFLDALQTLQDAASSSGDAQLELRCRLVALAHLLPPLPADLADELAHTALASGPPPLAVKDAQKPVKSLLTQALTDLVDFVAARTRSGSSGLQDLAQGLDALQGQELRDVQWGVAVLVERCYWSLCQPTAGRSLNVKEAGKQAALLAAVSALRALFELRSAALGRPGCTDAAAEEALLRTASNILTARRALTLQHGAWVKACLARLAALLQAIQHAPQEAGSEDGVAAEEAEETGLLKARLEGAMAQCLHVLYGVDLPHRDPDWGSMEDQMVTRVAMRTPEECLEAWHYIRPYAEGIAQDKKALSRLQHVLEAMQKHFPAPPQPVLDAWQPAALLDAADVDEARLLEGPRPGVAEQLLAPPSKLQQAVGADEHADMHSTLHHLLLRLQPDLEVLHKEEAALLPSGAAAVDTLVQLACYDIRYNPIRYYAWDRIAAMYREASEAILKMGAAELSVDEWHSDGNANLRKRLKLYQARAARGTLIARQLAPAEDVVFHDEQILMLLYERMQHAPPLYDFLHRVPDRIHVQQLAAEAARACERAIAGLPDEWAFHTYLGKMRSKAGCTPEQYLPDLARACALAAVHAGGLVEPIYRLHGTRLKLLHQPHSLTPAALLLLARYCFDAERQQTANGVMQRASNRGNHVGELVDLLIADGEAAMHWVLEKDRDFHKARHALARSLQARDSFKEAAEQLHHLFTSPKRPFCISMWEIGDKLTKAGAEAEGTSGAGEGASSALTDESSWGRQPQHTAGNGMEESHRKFLACRRKYLIRYLGLLAKTGNVATLAAAHSFLCLPQHWPVPGMVSDIASLALGHCIMTLAAQLRQLLPHLADLSGQGNAVGSLNSPAQVPGQTPGQSASLPANGTQGSLGAFSSEAGMIGTVQGRPVVHNEALPLLEAAYGLYTEHYILAGLDHGPSHWAAALKAVQPVDPLLDKWTGEAAFERSACAYIEELGRRGQLDELQACLASVRKRCKALRTANERVQVLLVRIATAAAGALVDALLDLERRQALAGNGNRADLHHEEAVEVRMAIWQPDMATPAKAPPTAHVKQSQMGMATPPAQVGRPGGNTVSQENAAVQQASLELLRHAHYLYKSGVARLPTVASMTGSLGRLDELLVRAYKLHRGTPHATITAADAAAAYDELARATRRASPSGKTSGAAARAERGVEGPRRPGVAEEGGREAAARQQVLPHQGGQGTAPEAATTSAPGADAAARGAASGEAAEAAAAEPSTPLTRKRSRREAELAGAVAALVAQVYAADFGEDPACTAVPSGEPNGAPRDGVQLPGDGPPGARIEGGQSAPGNTPADQAGAGALGALLGDTSDFAVPIRGPSSWGRGWAITDGIVSAGPADSAAGMRVVAVTQEGEPHMASSESTLHAAKRMRHNV